MTAEPAAQQILDTPMEANDSGADTIRGYLIKLLEVLWQHGEGFSGKRPFGNSGWEYDLFAALGRAGHIRCTFDEDGYIDDVDDTAGDRLILDAIKHLGESSERQVRERVAAEILTDLAEREQRTPDGRPIAAPATPTGVRIRLERRRQAERDAQIARGQS